MVSFAKRKLFAWTEKAELEQTRKSYKSFIKKYKKNSDAKRYVANIELELHELDFKSATTLSSLEEYQNYLSKYEKQSRFLEQVEFIRSLMIRQSLLYYENEKYVGSTKNGQFHGQGVFYSKEGKLYMQVIS